MRQIIFFFLVISIIQLVYLICLTDEQYAGWRRRQTSDRRGSKTSAGSQQSALRKQPVEGECFIELHVLCGGFWVMCCACVPVLALGQRFDFRLLLLLLFPLVRD